eukprot:3941653-Rhodomonas_salina.7
MSGTDMAYVASCFALSCTDRVRAPLCLRSCYAMSDTGISYDITRCPVLTRRMLLQQRSSPLPLCFSCYAMSGTETPVGAVRLGRYWKSRCALCSTDIAYSATRC